MATSGTLANDMQKRESPLAASEHLLTDTIASSNSSRIDNQMLWRSPEARGLQFFAESGDQAHQLIAVGDSLRV